MPPSGPGIMGYLRGSLRLSGNVSVNVRVRAWCHDCCTTLIQDEWTLVTRLCQMMMGQPIPSIDAETLLALRTMGWSLGQTYGAPSCDWWRAVLHVAQAEQGERTPARVQVLNESWAALWRATWAELATLEQRGWLVGCKPLPTFEAWGELKSWGPESKTPILFGGVHILEGSRRPRTAPTPHPDTTLAAPNHSAVLQ